jgi:hypothetical protein
MHSIVYMKPMLTCFLKILNNVTSCIPLDTLNLNPNYKIDTVNFI